MKKLNVDKNAMRRALVMTYNTYWNPKKWLPRLYWLTIFVILPLLLNGKLDVGLLKYIVNNLIVAIVMTGEMTAVAYPLCKD